MKHAATLDLTTFEDPDFQDTLERARVQGADRIGMVQAMGQLIQEMITTVTLAAAIYLVSPWILLGLVAFIVPAFLGETHFAFMGYSLSVQQTSARRELDYLRMLGASRESAKNRNYSASALSSWSATRRFQMSSIIRTLDWRGAGCCWDRFYLFSERWATTALMRTASIKPLPGC